MDLTNISQQIELYKNQENRKEISNQLQNLGKKEIENNSFFTFLNKLMTNNDLRPYIDEYFGEWSDIETTIMFIKLYQSIENEFKKNGCETTGEEIIAIVKGLITTPVYRQEIVQEMRRYQGFDEKQKCLEYVSKKVKAIKKPFDDGIL